MAKTKTYTWKDPGGLTVAVVAVMIFDVLWAGGGLAIGLSWGQAADYTQAADEAFDIPQLVGWFHDLMAIPSLLLLIVPFFWILRVSKNAHVLKGRPLRNSPMFAALWWYLIPFMSLFKPPESLGEIWDVSATGVATRNRARVMLAVWWGATLIGNIARIAAGRMTGAPEVQDLAVALKSFGDVASIVQCVAFIVIANRICSMQKEKRLVSEFSDADIEQGILQGLSA